MIDVGIMSSLPDLPEKHQARVDGFALRMTEETAEDGGSSDGTTLAEARIVVNGQVHAIFSHKKPMGELHVESRLSAP